MTHSGQNREAWITCQQPHWSTHIQGRTCKIVLGQNTQSVSTLVCYYWWIAHNLFPSADSLPSELLHYFNIRSKMSIRLREATYLCINVHVCNIHGRPRQYLYLFAFCHYHGDKHLDQSTLGRTGLILLTLLCSSVPLREVSPGTQAGIESEAREECCFLACSLWFAHPAFLENQDHLLRCGTTLSVLGLHT